MKNTLISFCLLSFILITASSGKKIEPTSISLNYRALEKDNTIQNLPVYIDINNYSSKKIILNNKIITKEKINDIVQYSPIISEFKEDYQDIKEIFSGTSREVSEKITQYFYKNNKYYGFLNDKPHMFLINNYIINSKNHNIDFLNNYIQKENNPRINSIARSFIKKDYKEYINWDEAKFDFNTNFPVQLLDSYGKISIDLVYLEPVSDLIYKKVEKSIQKIQENFEENKKIEQELKNSKGVVSKHNKSHWFFYCFLAAIGATGFGLFKTGMLEVKFNI